MQKKEDREIWVWNGCLGNENLMGQRDPPIKTDDPLIKYT